MPKEKRTDRRIIVGLSGGYKTTLSDPEGELERMSWEKILGEDETVVTIGTSIVARSSAIQYARFYREGEE